MNKHAFDSLTTDALRSLDPAFPSTLSDAERERAAATFERIVSIPRGTPPQRSQVRRARSRWSSRRVLVPVGLAAAAAVAVPVFSTGNGSAFASWTPTPEAIVGADATEAAAACRSVMGMPDAGQDVVLAERRGGWTYVLLTGSGAEGACVMDDRLVGEDNPPGPGKVGYMGHFSSDAPQAPTVGASDIDWTGGAGAMPVDGPWPFKKDESWLTWVEGYVGNDVTGVVVHTPIGTDVQASVADGRFAAWWPSPMPSSKNPEVDGASAFTVTLSDGTTREIAN